MTKEDPEPVERLQEFMVHPTDTTFNSLHDKGLTAKKELAQERHELGLLMSQLPQTIPQNGTQEHFHYTEMQKQIETLKQRVSKKHDELMEILKSEEKISREIQQKKS